MKKAFGKMRVLMTVAAVSLLLPSTTLLLAGNAHYPDNRSPLREKPFTSLPLGSVRASGWLLQQLELQRDGLTGHAEEAIPDLDPNSGWLGGEGENWERGPYYVKGLVPLAYTLKDETLKNRASKWIEWTLKSQRPDGFYGPSKNDDWWPRMVMNYVLRDYAEATGDPRIVPFLTRYYRFMAGELPKRPLRDWGKARAGDDMDTIAWLYNRTGDAFLLELVELLQKQAYDWLSIHSENRWQHFGTDFHPRHGVNVPQGLKFGPVYWQFSGKEEFRSAYEKAWQHLTRDHGLSFGMHSSSEFLGGNSSGQGTEFCSIVEKMLSDETVMRITGQPELGDRLEQLAFNALPAAWTKDLRAYQYYTLPNQVIAKREGNGFFLDYDDGLLPGPHSGCHCCCYNVHMGWPKLVQNSWAATADNGLAVLAYAPTEVSARVADGATVTITEETAYPFEEQVRFTIGTKGSSVQFPLWLRMPAWCAKPVVKVNGKRQSRVKAGKFFTLNRSWKDGDQVTVDLPMAVRVVAGIHNSRHVEYGPLLFSLHLGAEWSIATKEKSGFHEYEVTSTTPWNYALLLNAKKPEKSFQVIRQPMEGSPFAHPPIQLKAQAKRLPDWELAWHGRMAFDPPFSPVQSTEAVETVTLKPFGSLTLRVTDFPWIGKPRSAASTFKDNFDDGNSVGWVVYGGGWPVRDGKLTVAATGGCSPWPGYKCVATGTQFRDFRYEADVAVGPVGNAGLIFRVSKA
ncbi:MAG TPA: beta-L-arabinofuranosidase domain-containing protein, partial [Clostridia bacterium]|nr:beta-L-arabinofuranosidase domain-containing protein [Clostridia bacterium]